MIRNKTPHPSLHRRQHLQFLPEQRGEAPGNHCCEQFSAVGKQGWQISALVSPTNTLNRDVAPIGDDIEPVGKSRADVEMVKEEDEEPLETEIPRVRMYPKESNEQRETRT